MPIVRATRRVAPTTLPGARVSAPSGAGAAIVPQALQRAGSQITQLGGQLEAVERQETAIEAQRAKNQAIFKDKSDKLWASQQIIKTQDYWRDKGPTFTAGKGSAAIGSTDAASQDLEKFKTSILDSAQNNEQRALYDASFAVKREVILNKQKAFEVDQFRKAEVVTNDSKIANAMRDAADNPNDELAIFDAGEDLREGIDFAIQGMAPEQRKTVTATYVSTFHEGILNSMVTGNANNAQIYYDKNKKNILPDKRPAIEKTLETEDTLQFAQNAADDLMLLYPDDHTKRLEVAREIEDAKKREKTVAKLKTRKVEQDQHQKEVDHEVELATLNNVLNAPNWEAANDIVDRIENPKERIEAQKVSDNRFKKKDVATTTDRQVQADVYNKIASGEIKVVDDLIKYSPYLSDADYTRMITELKNTNKAKEGVDTPYIKDATAKNAYELVTGAKFDIKDDSSEYMFVREGLDAKARELGRNLTPVEAQKEAAKLLVEGEVDRKWWFNDTLTRQEATQQGKLDVWVPKVNDEDIDDGEQRRKIKEAFERRGIKATDEDLYQLYKKKVILRLSLSEKQATLFNKLKEEAERIK